MAENEDRSDAWLLQVSLKTSGQSLINVRGMEAMDIEMGLNDIIALSDKIAEAETAVGAVQVVKQAMPGSRPAPAGPAAPPPVAPAGPVQAAPLCHHNVPAKYVKGGVSRGGRPYTAFWACDQGRDNDCGFKQTA